MQAGGSVVPATLATCRPKLILIPERGNSNHQCNRDHDTTAADPGRQCDSIASRNRFDDCGSVFEQKPQSRCLAERDTLLNTAPRVPKSDDYAPAISLAVSLYFNGTRSCRVPVAKPVSVPRAVVGHVRRAATSRRQCDRGQWWWPPPPSAWHMVPGL